MTDIKLELIIDIDKFQFIEKGMRGAVSYITNHYSKANNKYTKEYDEKVPSKCIRYLDIYLAVVLDGLQIKNQPNRLG